VLGIASPEYGVDGTPEITESWVVLNGGSIDPADVDGLAFTGVMTHEFGHAINLGHSQVNGAIVLYGDATGPGECGDLPYSGTPTADDVETMYPILDHRIDGGTGVAQSTVDVTDDVVSISNLYPTPDWLASHGTISGTISYPDGVTQISGVNVVARNVANPYHDAVSVMSGDVLRADPSRAGSYQLNGLTSGATYVVAVDGIAVGGFSTPVALFLPGREEFASGARESGDARTDAACDAERFAVTAGAPIVANVTFDAVAGAPELHVLGREAAPFDITADGETIVGYYYYDIAAPTWRWTKPTGLVSLGGAGSTAAIAADGSAIASNTLGAEGFQTASLWQGGEAWTPLPTLGGSCDGSLPQTNTVAFGVSKNAGKVVGLGYVGENCGAPRAFVWDRATNATTVLETPEGSLQSRANGISRDGSIVWGFRVGETGFREAAVWTNGSYQSLSTDAAPVGEAYRGSPDGKFVVGGYATFDLKAWMWSRKSGVRIIEGLPDSTQSQAFAVNGKGTVVVGQSGDFFSSAGFLWTPGLGAMKLEDFLRTQGTFVDPSVTLYGPNLLSASGRRIAGNGFSSNGGFGWYVDLSTVTMCHEGTRTVSVAFPERMDKHLAHGDTLGACPRTIHGRP
jgi:uncharacterized membrane protein